MTLSEPEAKQGRLQLDLPVLVALSSGNVEFVGYDGWDGSDATPQPFVNVAGLTRTVDTQVPNEIFVAAESSDDGVPFFEVSGAEQDGKLSRK